MDLKAKISIDSVMEKEKQFAYLKQKHKGMMKGEMIMKNQQDRSEYQDVILI